MSLYVGLCMYVCTDGMLQTEIRVPFLQSHL